jgi:hypothetical protein
VAAVRRLQQSPDWLVLRDLFLAHQRVREADRNNLGRPGKATKTDAEWRSEFNYLQGMIDGIFLCIQLPETILDSLEPKEGENT